MPGENISAGDGMILVIIKSFVEIDDDKVLDFDEVHEFIFAVIGDGRILSQEIQDLKEIARHSKSLRGRGKLLLDQFLANPRKFMEHNQKK